MGDAVLHPSREDRQEGIVLRIVLIYMRFFWPVVPALVIALGVAWLLWGMGLWLSIVLPLATGVLVFLFLAFIAACVETT